MASAKDIYEAHIYRANIYAAGVWRGVGEVVVEEPPTVTGMEFRLSGERLHYRLSGERMHYRVDKREE